MKRIQNFYLYSYRLTGFIFLSGLISSILWYGFSMIFFIASTSWSVPLILSPHQEKVMTHLEHLLNIEQQFSKNTAELKAAQKALIDKSEILKNALLLENRVQESMVAQAVQYAKNSLVLDKFNQEKKQTIDRMNNLLMEIQNKEQLINKELKMGLITKQEALSQQIYLSNLHTSLIDSKSRAHELEQKSIDFANASTTLNGDSANNLVAMHKVIKKVELDRQVAELKIDTYALQSKIKELKFTIHKLQVALDIMKKSPYILATKGAQTVAFIPYANLKNVRNGSPVYSCYFDMIFCYKAGHVTEVYKGEEYGRHPIFKSDTKGRFIGIKFNSKADAQKKLVFLNSKPLIV